MLYLSKSKYCALWQCPKIAWLNAHKPEAYQINGDIQARLDAGNQIGDLAMGLFGPYVEVTAYRDDKIDLAQMLRNTQTEMAKGTPVICEASFQYNGLYCAVDILKREKGGWAIYEVKSSTDSEHEIYLADVAYQKYVLEHCGVLVTGVFIVTINNRYVRQGELDIGQLFQIDDVMALTKGEEEKIEANLEMAETVQNLPGEPPIDLSMNCRTPYTCGYWAYCSRHLPTPSVFDLYRLPFKKKLAYYLSGRADYPSLLRSKVITNPTQLRQMEYATEDLEPYVDKRAIKDFLGTLSYPLYFLDFETVQPVVPIYDGTRPYQQIPFQYSLHYIEGEGGALLHREFLAESGPDPRRDIAEALCRDIPQNVCVTAYNKSFECTRLQELANQFPDLAEHLINIRDHIVDLLVPFQSGWYYNRAMGGSFSIKSVLPALFPDDPSLDYHNLESVHNGSEAMSIFPRIQAMPPAEREKARHDLLKYCELDTYAMVKVWEKLKEAAETG